MGDKWQFFGNNIKLERRFGDFFKVSHSVATLYNKAFILKDESYTISDDGNVISNGIILEKQLIKNAFSPRSVKYRKKEKIIFPYEVVDRDIVRIDKKLFKKRYPGIYTYLKRYVKELSGRNSDENAEWFEYGRSQAISNLNTNKILLSTVITNQINLSVLGTEDIPYSGLFIRTLDENNHPLDEAVNILKTPEFFSYAKSLGIPISGKSFRITSKDIENYTF